LLQGLLIAGLLAAKSPELLVSGSRQGVRLGWLFENAKSLAPPDAKFSGKHEASFDGFRGGV
jgi:hypothetical protein